MVPFTKKTFDKVAKPYWWLERIVLGRLLELVRSSQAEKLKNVDTVLILGEGDGRFLEQLLKLNPGCRVDVVERSAEMVKLARARTAERGATERVEFFLEDAATYRSIRSYDAIVSLFFLDCFVEPELGRIVKRAHALLNPGGVWVYADFSLPLANGRALGGRVVAAFQRSVIAALYWAFNSLTDIRATRLEDPREHFRSLGLSLHSEQSFSSGLVCAELWQSSRPI